MVTRLVFSLLACLPLAIDNPPADSKPEDTTRTVRDALGKGGFPWYDAKADAAKPIKPFREPDATPSPASPSGSAAGLFGSLSDLLVYLGFGAALAVMIGLLVWFWRIYEPTDVNKVEDKKKHGEPSRIDALPEGMDEEFASSDPWEEAIRRRKRGDLGGAIICLFAHQLLTLSKLGLVRLAPGRTGRQLLKAVSDNDFRKMVHPTLRLFEVVYYGHRSPTEAEFADVWSAAESFERRVSSGVTS